MIKDLCWELLHDGLADHRFGLTEYAKATQSGRGQDHRINLALSHPLDSGVDIPADRHYVQPKTPAGRPVEELHGASWSPGSDPVAVDKIIKSAPYEHVSAVLTRRNSENLKIVCRSGRQVLQRVHGNVDLAAPQGIAYGADENACAADLSEVALINITGCGNSDEARVDAVARQRCSHLVRLGAGEGRSARAEPDRPGQTGCIHQGRRNTSAPPHQCYRFSDCWVDCTSSGSDLWGHDRRHGLRVKREELAQCGRVVDGVGLRGQLLDAYGRRV
jgi:hypothetical protein